MTLYLYIGLCVKGNACTFYSLLGNGDQVEEYLPTKSSRIVQFEGESGLQAELNEFAEASLFDVSEDVVICYYGMKPVVKKQCKYVGIDEGPLKNGYAIACDEADSLMRRIKDDPNVISLHRLHKKAKCEGYEAEVVYEDHMLQVVIRNTSKMFSTCIKTDRVDFWVREVGIMLTVRQEENYHVASVVLGLKCFVDIKPLTATVRINDDRTCEVIKPFERLQ